MTTGRYAPRVTRPNNIDVIIIIKENMIGGCSELIDKDAQK